MIARNIISGARTLSGILIILVNRGVANIPTKNTTIPAINSDQPNEYTKEPSVAKSSGPGFNPLNINAPAITAAGADPGTPRVTNGIIAAGAAALLAISEAVTPRI